MEFPGVRATQEFGEIQNLRSMVIEDDLHRIPTLQAAAKHTTVALNIIFPVFFCGWVSAADLPLHGEINNHPAQTLDAVEIQLAQSENQAANKPSKTDPWWEELSEKLGTNGKTEVLPELPPEVGQPDTVQQDNKQSPGQETESEQSDQQQHIADLLASAQQQLAANRLTTPADDNALTTYRRILELAPQQNQAQDGIAAIISRYKNWSIRALNSGQYATAEQYLKRAMAIEPNDTSLAKIRRDVRIARQATKLRARENQAKSANTQSLSPQTVTPNPSPQANQANSPKLIPGNAGIDTDAQRIQSLLSRAQQQIDRGQFVDPPRNNAWETLNQVLSIDNDNQQARNGLQMIPIQLSSHIRKQFNQGEIEASLKITNQGLQRFPGHPDLILLQNQITRQLQAKQNEAEPVETPTTVEETESDIDNQKRNSGIIRPYGTF